MIKKLIFFFTLCYTFSFLQAQDKTDLAVLVSGTYEVSPWNSGRSQPNTTLTVERIDNNKIRISCKGQTSYDVDVVQLSDRKIGGPGSMHVVFEDMGVRIFINGSSPDSKWGFTGSRLGSLMHPPMITPEFIDKISTLYFDDENEGSFTREADNTINIRFFKEHIRKYARKLTPPFDATITNLIEVIKKDESRRAKATEDLADTIFTRSNFKKHDGKLPGDQGFDGLYSYGDNLNVAYVIECKQWSRQPVGNNQWDSVIQLSSDSKAGKPAQMTDAWILDVQERLKTNGKQGAFNFLNTKGQERIKLIIAVNQRSSEVYFLKIDQDKARKEAEKEKKAEQEKAEQEKADKQKVNQEKIEQGKETIEKVKRFPKSLPKL